MAWDGWFNAATLVLTTVEGWGLFNIVEGLIDHHVLGLHHVRDIPAHVPAYDWVFLGLGGVGLIAISAWLSRTPSPAGERDYGRSRLTNSTPRTRPRSSANPGA